MADTVSDSHFFPDLTNIFVRFNKRGFEALPSKFDNKIKHGKKI